jgi:hypothetical protein
VSGQLASAIREADELGEREYPSELTGPSNSEAVLLFAVFKYLHQPGSRA